MQRDYAPRGVKFYYLYKALAHPETNGYVNPFTLQERLMHVREAQRTIGSEFSWICDTMANDIKHALGNAPNSEFIIGPDGKVAVRRLWCNPRQLRQDLEELIGSVENPTSASDVKLRFTPPPKVAPRGVVPRLDVPGRMQALVIEPQIKEGELPFYAKLRAEADGQLLRTGKGKLYLGFRLDPLYGVHWNNLTKPIAFELVPPQGVKVTPKTGEGPEVEEPSDIDPREFLIEVDAWETRRPIEIVVRYFACHDEQGWCLAVTQKYKIHLEVDADAGRTSRRFRFGGR